ncbi:AAA family ATPase [Paracoccus chinensis]|uniref:Uncharacterized protein YhaN n=1 Tax=Paracoccus chinensis TaxID=525640 RepID=A0A1G9KGP6_9RHOB|nr:AAA family ATPase [Paracoccus chinensis]SDL48553.1 Uncharacterized protein YhaN [Paracoccus chinensis]
MRLRRLDLTRYGRFTDRSLDFGAAEPGRPDLHIVHGPNEAGKSTLLNAWLDLLFGIHARSSYNFLHPYDALRIGAVLDLPDGQRELVRVKKTRESLLDPAGRPVSDGMLRAALGGIERKDCADMFALDAGSMEDGGELILSSKGNLGQLLFSASAGLAELGDRLDGLRAEADAFYKKSARKGTLKDMRGELEALVAERKALDVQAAEHRARRQTADKAEAERDAAAEAHARAAAAREAAKAALEALPWLAEWSAIDAELAPLEELPDVPPAWPARVAALQADDVALRTEAALDAERRQALCAALAALVPDDTALAQAEAAGFDEDLKARWIAARDDLPRRLQELAAARQRIEGLGRQILPDADPASLEVGAGTLDRLAELMTAHEGLSARLASARAEVAARVDELAAAGGPLDDEGAEDGTTALREALAPLRRADLAGRRDEALANAAEAAARLDAALARLAPWKGDAATLRALEVPSTERLGTWAARLDAATAVRDTAARVAADRAGEARRRAAERDGLADSIGPADPQRVAESRARRDAAWEAHLAAMDAATARAFAETMEAHDRAVSAQLDRAADIGRLHGAREDAATAERLAEAAARDLAVAEAALAELRATLAARAGAILPGRDPADPLADLSGWLARHERALNLADEAEAAARAAERAEAEAAQAEEALRTQLEAAGETPEGELRALAAQAQRLLDRHEAEAARRAERLRLTRELAARRQAEAAARRALDDWQRTLTEACAPTFLAEAPPDAARLRALLSPLRELGAALAVTEDLRHRTEAMQEDQHRFADAVDALASALDLPPGDPLARHAVAAARLAEARRTAERRATLAEDLARADAARHALAQRRARLDVEAATITAHLGAPDLTHAQAALARIARRAELRDRAARLDAQIRAALGVPSLDEARARLSGTTPDELRAALVRAEDAQAETEGRLESARAALYAARHALDAVTGDDRVARIEARRRALLIGIEEEARAWLRLRAGVIATDHALRSYRDHHRSGMMARASDAFAAITGGAYRGLTSQPGEGTERLIAVAADGGSKEPGALSKGTRFQLYLALRIAGFHEWTGAHGPVPVIADDIMETFDDTRTRLALRALAEMSRSGQVIYLTHHRHVCELAREACPEARILELGP